MLFIRDPDFIITAPADDLASLGRTVFNETSVGAKVGMKGFLSNWQRAVYMVNAMAASDLATQ